MGGKVRVATTWRGSGLMAALLLFVSVLLHELSHAFVARAYGLPLHGITLHIFGGVSELGDEDLTHVLALRGAGRVAVAPDEKTSRRWRRVA